MVLRERGKEHSGFLIAQTTGVSLIPRLAGGVEEMKRRVPPFPPPSIISGSSSLRAFYPLSRFLFISEYANFISTLQHMVPPSFQHACRPAHKGHFLNTSCTSHYQAHQKLKTAVKRDCTEVLWQHSRSGPKTKEICFTILMQEPYFHIWWEKAWLPCL